MRKIVGVLLLTVMLAAVAGFASWCVYFRESHSLSSCVFGGRKAFDAFRAAPEITAERLHCTVEDGSASLADYRRDSAVPLSGQQVEQVKNLFSTRDSYSPDLWRLPSGVSIVTACGPPNYGVLLTSRSVPAVRIALCFHCDQFGIFIGDDDHSPYVNRDDRFGLIRPVLVDVVKSIFPSDREIQSLQRER